MSQLAEDLAWFDEWKKSPDYIRLSGRPVAYFCAEYALVNNIPTFAGGLGILAGDVVREAADRGLPLVAVGLYYRQGYVCPTMTTNGTIVEECVDVAPETVGLKLVLEDTGQPLIIKVPIQNRYVEAQVWEWQQGSVKVYLLETDVATNSTADRKITQRLYVADTEIRFKQAILLGIGGLRLLEALHIHPSVYHLNEGHSALLGLELIHHEMKERSLGFDEAIQFARRRMVLTNHTLVAAGNEVYTDDLVSLLLTRYAEEIAVPLGDLVKLGLVADSSSFSMTMLALRLSSVVNAVSKLHAKKAKEIWHDHPMAAITNGVHLSAWDQTRGDLEAGGAFWRVHQGQKNKLLEKIKEKTGRVWESDTLLLGWARRITSYKRPLGLFEDAKRFAEIARRTDKPVRVVFAGRPHPADIEGLQLLKDLCALIEGELKDVAAYLPEYNLETASLMVSGCDVWLNTPVVGFEASGTSGMKAALNGVLPCSTKDGWVDEAEFYRVGWLVDSTKLGSDLLDRVEHDIASLYYERNVDGVPESWEELMHNSRDMAQNQFSATRMLRGYIQTLYS